ncbi:MAG: hypothetical protein AUK37_05940 [Rhodobacterales bacterium CG2_30_65_12]|nr:MAG: hypothetical protein AUK37_05940 [Rhodobacterales bacterium CG2_30_65_12]
MTRAKTETTGQDAKPTAPKKRKRRGARGVLWIIALMLAASGALRLSGGSGLAIASGIADAVTDPTAYDCAPPPDIAEVLALLDTREAAVSVREAAVSDRMQALAVAEAQIARNMTALKAAESSLEATMALASNAAEEDLARLTAVYENMKPKEAAPLFAAMAPEFAAGFLARMRPDAAAAIMSRLEPENAYSISVLLAGRNANAPTR